MHSGNNAVSIILFCSLILGLPGSGMAQDYDIEVLSLRYAHGSLHREPIEPGDALAIRVVDPTPARDGATGRLFQGNVEVLKKRPHSSGPDAQGDACFIYRTSQLTPTVDGNELRFGAFPESYFPSTKGSAATFLVVFEKARLESPMSISIKEKVLTDYFARAYEFRTVQPPEKGFAAAAIDWAAGLLDRVARGSDRAGTQSGPTAGGGAPTGSGSGGGGAASRPPDELRERVCMRWRGDGKRVLVAESCQACPGLEAKWLMARLDGRARPYLVPLTIGRQDPANGPE